MSNCHHNPCSGGNGFLGGCTPVIPVPERDHNKLENRDEANQHPIEAITNLRTELDQMNQDSDVLEDQLEEATEKSAANATAIGQLQQELKRTVKESDLQTLSNSEILNILNN